MRIGLLLLGLTLIQVPPARSQVLDWARQKVKTFLNDTASSAKPRFITYPTLAYAPETSWEIGLSSLYLFHARNDTLNRLSEVNAFTFITLAQQYGIWLDHALYSHQDQWFFLGRLRWQSFPLFYHGIGPKTPDQKVALVDARSLQLRERILRKISGSFFLGPQFDFQRLQRVSFDWEASPGQLPIGGQGSSNLGLGLGLVYDNRHNVLNVRDGLFAELAYLNYNNSLLSDFTFSSITFETRWFKPFPRNQVLAVQVLGQSIWGEVPFNQLALMGGESLMRGYYLGRYRDRKLLAGQVEYRWLPFPFSRRWGAAVYLSAGQVAPDISRLSIQQFKPAGGAGLRFLLFKKKDIFTRLDVAFTEEGNGFYLFIGEAF
ncbi:MAG: BamA/TamA family outer membrane protein [Candidatus Cyclobacteriaceae bacterium M3_2C_046]